MVDGAVVEVEEFSWTFDLEWVGGTCVRHVGQGSTIGTKSTIKLIVALNSNGVLVLRTAANRDHIIYQLKTKVQVKNHFASNRSMHLRPILLFGLAIFLFLDETVNGKEDLEGYHADAKVEENQNRVATAA
eukprot:scaffold17877_cov62-Skeletonema_dohrnii-CCMP3373.AAC.2